MRLTELSPKWVWLPQWSKQSPTFYVGVSFNCPCGPCNASACPTCGHRPDPKRLAVMFWPPIDPECLLGKMFELADNNGHRRTGDSFETLTLTPSVGFDSIGHWHGCITDGEIK